MSNKHHSNPLEKEFELERMVLFSDAVFAIAITLLVIDIKWPELPEKLANIDVMHLMQPTIYGFVGFAVSFFFIGKAWSVHLRLFRLLRKYDQGLINRNLLFLFFIATFPFAAAGMAGHLRNEFMIPIFFYLTNLSMVAVMHYVLCRYVLYRHPALSVEGEEAEKKYIHNRARYIALMAVTITVLSSTVLIIFPSHPEFIGYICVAMGIVTRFFTKKTNKFKPA